MGQEFREFAVTVPAGTAKTAPLVTDVSFPARTVLAVSWRVPPGPSGLMGWQLTSAGAPVIPIQPGAYVVTDNQAATWPLAGYLDSGNWQVTAYNTGLYDHTLYLTFELDLPGAAVPAAPVPAGTGTGVVGTSGSVPGTSGVPGGGVSPGPSLPGDTPAVIAVVLAAAARQAAAAAAVAAGGS